MGNQEETVSDTLAKLRAFWMRLSGLVHKAEGDDDLEAELASHLAMHIEDGP